MNDKAAYQSVSQGELALRLDNNGSFAREITIGGEEAFRGIGFVVRDVNWGTPALTADAAVSRQGDRVAASANGELKTPGGDLAWSVSWSIADRSLEAKCRASSIAGFDTNRTGFVVLHSLGATRGRAVKVLHDDGAIEETTFPDLVSPHQPFFDIRALEYTTASGHRLRLSFAGEIFEIEDQRNWTDASYKTYCRPLRIPYPYRIGPSTVVEQSVRLEILDVASSRSKANRLEPQIATSAALPVIGVSLPPGPIKADEIAALKLLPLGFTAIEIDLSAVDGLATAKEKIIAAPGPLRVDIRKGEERETLAAVSTLAPLLAERPTIGLSLWDVEDATIAAARSAARRSQNRRRLRQLLY